ncbi:MAG: cation:proton antiporter [Deltaproteobacteria bacterium]|nr:cation:proton antiporter [Deltaproteobacteria bacterium]
MDPVWIAIALFFGLAAKQVSLPPMVGYLLAGFVLSALGVEGGQVLEQLANIGVLLLLFGIGLKLRIKMLLMPEVWVGASIHMVATSVVFGAGMYGLSIAGLFIFAGMDFSTSLIVAFALSFSSTVFAVKVLEDKGEMRSLHGRKAVGILIMQDIFAVLFLAATMGKIPSPWALLLFGLFLLRPLFVAILNRCGHGELLILFGLFMALVLGGFGFPLVGVKADLGAIFLGALIADHAKAKELANSILSFKDIFLVGFFLSIGLSGTLSFETVGVAFLLAAVLPFKVGLFFLILVRFGLRSRTSFLASINLANYSEFGLFVAAAGVGKGWLHGDWLMIIAMALAITFLAASLLSSSGNRIFVRFEDFLKRFETKIPHPDDEPFDIGQAKILIFGMGRIGFGAYSEMVSKHGDAVIGIDSDPAVVYGHTKAGRNVIEGNAADIDLWRKLQHDHVEVVMLTMPHHAGNLFAAKQLSASGFKGFVAATVMFSDHAESLKEEGVQAVYNFYTEAGAGFANHIDCDSSLGTSATVSD